MAGEMRNKRWVVVEMAGMIGERDVRSFESGAAAFDFVRNHYSEAERDTLNHSRCKWPDVRFDWTDDDGEHQEFGCS